MDVHQAEIKILSAGGLVTVDGDQMFVRLERRPAPEAFPFRISHEE
jgi:hypothetical protein